ncbi:MAG: gamma-glutamyl-gamma-aminobutyrate hydrolase family protein [Actinobacteria bacterium]|nr:gamma-glutamyl-gamma-aminobutyrate hydrolase family protein [Actinomycetota bacterium]
MSSYRILVVDNFDSFVYNIVQYLEELGAHCSVMKNDEISLKSISTYDGVLISPGPGSPESAGASIEVVLECARLEIPMLGVCLGLQTLAVAYGGEVDQAPELLHGRTSEIFHRSSALFNGIPSPFKATRYHSLAVTRVPDELEITAETADGVVMALVHRSLPLMSVQFHPEAILSEHGHQIFKNWLATI